MNFGFQLVFRIVIKDKISVIMPNYNSYDFFEESINSVLNQTYKNFDLIIVDDGSTSKKVSDIYNKYKLLKNIKIIVTENRGLPNARNEGLNNSNAEFVTFLDSDDRFDSKALEVFRKNYKNDDEFLYFGYNLFGDQNKISYKYCNNLEQLFINQIPYSIFIKRNLINSVGKYDESFINGFEDWDLNIRLLSNNLKGILIKKPYFYYHFSSKGMLFSKSIFQYSQLLTKIKNKNVKMYKFKNIVNSYFQNKKTKSTYRLEFYLIWFIIVSVLPHSLINFIYINMFRFFSKSLK